MKNIFYIIVAVGVALLANSVSAIWARQPNRFSIWLIAVILLSPLVFITYGIVTSKVGLSIAAGTVDSLLTLSTIAVGLIIFHEWDKLTSLQYVGIAFAIVGIFLMVFTSSK